MEHRHRSHFRLRWVKRAENLLFFRRCQNAQLGNSRRRVAENGFKQLQVVSGQFLHRFGFIKSSGVFKQIFQASLDLRDVQAEIEFRNNFFAGIRRQMESGKLDFQILCILQSKHRIE
ncbi:hypothetical protein D3C73_1112720 [compost metagenome]